MLRKATKIVIILLIITMLFSLTGCECRHEWKPATCTAPKTCIKCGETEGEPLGHDWAPATCTEPKTCKRCGATEGEALGHDWIPATCTEPKTCRTCGATEGKPLGHDWEEATCTEKKTCKRCGLKVGMPLGHDAPDLTCTTDGICVRCGEVVPAPGHSWQPATCTEPKTCSRCGLTEGEPLGHTTNCGICSRCGKEIYEPVTGSGDDVVTVNLNANKLYKIHMKYTGGSVFAMMLYNDDGKLNSMLASSYGDYEGTALVDVDGPAVIEITAIGDWEFYFEPI